MHDRMTTSRNQRWWAMAAKAARCALLLFAATRAGAANIGDTYQQVLAEKGPPRSRIEAGSLEVLNYPDATIKLRDGLVISLTAISPPGRQGVAAAPAPLTPAQRLAAAESTLRDAVARVQNIVNQPVPMAMRTPQMRVWDYDTWFHPGSLKPDFNTIDVRRTQESPYDGQDYVSLKSRPNLVWRGVDLEFNSMLKFFYTDRSVPKKRLTGEEMVEINRLYRIIGTCEKELNAAGILLKPSS